uniref:Uncharacterized protein n=1 Tax=Glossina austeni TaxID=7395 RepID=A0A1A9UP36_GLOAU
MERHKSTRSTLTDLCTFINNYLQLGNTNARHAQNNHYCLLQVAMNADLIVVPVEEKLECRASQVMHSTRISDTHHPEITCTCLHCVACSRCSRSIMEEGFTFHSNNNKKTSVAGTMRNNFLLLFRFQAKEKMSNVCNSFPSTWFQL